MDLSQVLAQAQSEDHATRVAAEAHLKQAEETQTAPFSLALTGELSNKSRDVRVRQLAGLQLKNLVDAKDEQLLEAKKQRWLQVVDAGTKNNIHQQLLENLLDQQQEVRHTSAQCIGAIAAFDVPQKAWPGLIEGILSCVTSPQAPESSKQAALEACGYMCERLEEDSIGAEETNKILTAIVDGVKDGRPDNTRRAAINAMQNSLEFCEHNFKSEAERTMIMQVVCGATQSPTPEVRSLAFQCLARIGELYYEHLGQYIETIFKLTMEAMSGPSEDVSLCAIEFWSTICDEEIALGEFEQADGGEQRVLNYVMGATQGGLAMKLLECMCKQDEHMDEGEWNLAAAAAVCLGLCAQSITDNIVQCVLPFVVQHISSAEWRFREASLMAFGQILDGPQDNMQQTVSQAMPFIVQALTDGHVMVKDTAAWTLSRVFELHPEAIAPAFLDGIFTNLVLALEAEPSVAEKACTCLHHMAESKDEIAGGQWLTPELFGTLLEKLIKVTDRSDWNEHNLRSTAYETVNMLIEQHSPACRAIVIQFAQMICQRLEATFAMQVVSNDDKDEREGLQSQLVATLHMIIRHCEPEEVHPMADIVMGLLLRVLTARAATASEETFMAIGAVASTVDENFSRYTEAFMPLLFAGLQNSEEYQVLSAAVGTTGDLCRALEGGIAMYCNEIVTFLLQALQNPKLRKDVKPTVLSTFGDIALALAAQFQPYLQATLGVVYMASLTRVDPEDEDLVEYLNSLREGILDAYTGIINGLVDGQCIQLLAQVPVTNPASGTNISALEGIVEFLGMLAADGTIDDVVKISATGLVGDIANHLGPLTAQLLKTPQIQQLLNATDSIRTEDGGRDQKAVETLSYTQNQLRNLG